MTSNEIRQQFLSFFESKQHIIVASAPIVVKNDPTLLFINSGMAPFKGIFLGQEKAKFARIADSQKCLRVSGKHNDLEEVGIDTYHHTFFEMLGNWSFGDYFKEEAIAWAWELLTEIYKIDKDRLYVTVFEGYENDGLDADNETLEIWKKLIDESHILYGSKKDNFWEMGDSGPCGPCSEIHVDLRSDDERKLVDAKTLVNADHPQVVEIWNNVFMQYNRLASGKLEELPARHVDTGMGFERLCMALQGKISNYDTDVFQPLIEFLATLSGFPYPELAEERKGEKNNQAIAMRVIADHIRAVAFTIADGQLPSNTGAGYVIRRILRRAVRYGYTFLNLNEAFMYKLLPILSQEQKRMAQDALNRWWWPSIAMHGPADGQSVNSAQSMAWKIKMFSNDELRQKFIDQTVPQIEFLGLELPDPELQWNAARGHYDYGAIDWDDFFKVVKGFGPCNHERLAARNKAWVEGAWFREALSAHAAKQEQAQYRKVA